MAEAARSIRVRCERVNLAPVRRFVEGWLREQAVSARVAGQLLVAVDEICANIIVHGNQENPECWLTLRISRHDSELAFELTDRGLPFEPPPFAPPDLARHIRERRKGGLGLTLVHLIMDRVEFLHTPNGANLCRLTKRVAAA
jgi:serine/threonine-protein kinase RsbW